MSPYINAANASSDLERRYDLVATSDNPKAELQRQGTSIAHLIRKQRLPIGAVYQLEFAARRAGLSEPEIEATLRTAFHHARCGVIRTGRKRRAREEAA